MTYRTIGTPVPEVKSMTFSDISFSFERGL